MEYLIH
jgi:hypothetical protein